MWAHSSRLETSCDTMSRARSLAMSFACLCCCELAILLYSVPPRNQWGADDAVGSLLHWSLSAQELTEASRQDFTVGAHLLLCLETLERSQEWHPHALDTE